MEISIDTILNHIKKYKIEYIFLSISFINLIISMVLILNNNKYNQPRESNIIYESSAVEKKSSETYVDISGAINKPDVYKITEGTRLKELIEIAGGLRNDADLTYVQRQYNFAALLKDQQKIYIPSLQEADSSSEKDAGPGFVSINTSDESSLIDLPGIGSATADKIISGRPYSSIEELVEKKIVGKGLFEKIKNMVQL